MIKLNVGFRIVLNTTAAVLFAGMGLFCLPWGQNDPQSASGFFVLALYFFITSVSKAMTIQFGDIEEPNYSVFVEQVFQWINKWIAAGMLCVFAVPHPQFTGVLLWGAIAGVFAYSGLKNFAYVIYFVRKVVLSFMEQRRAIKEHLKRVKAQVELMKLEQEQERKEAQAEENLLADLNNFFANSDPTDNSRK